MIHDFIISLIDTLIAWGYVGIFLLTTLESSLLPIPSELVLIPAGFFSSPLQGKFNIWIVFLIALSGCVLGALLNYYLAYYLGRPLMLKLTKWFGVSEAHMERAETFFLENGEMSTFLGRLVPVVRHLISIPAGLTRMSVWKMSLYTALGGGLWTAILLSVGYFLGEQVTSTTFARLQNSILIIVVFVLVVWIGYMYMKKVTKRVVHSVESVGSECNLVMLFLTDREMKKKDRVRFVKDVQEVAMYEVIMAIDLEKGVNRKNTIAFQKKLDKVDPALRGEFEKIKSIDKDDNVRKVVLLSLIKK